MMSKERELLTRAVMALDSEYSNELMDEIKELLAQSEQAPDLWVLTNPWGVMELMWSEPREQVYANYKVTKFYRSPPTREPLSDEEIYTRCCAMDSSYTCIFIDGVEWAEHQHGIRSFDDE